MANPINRLLEIMRTLRGPNGCDWDKQQTLTSLKQYLLEETYELLDTMDHVVENPKKREIDHHKEELGDLLLQVVFQAQLQSELGNFDFDDIALAIVEKMERRHPHIFGDVKRDASVKGNPYWHAVKEEEQKGSEKIFHSVAKGQPALLRARKLGERAARLGFDWANPEDAFEKIQEEVLELKDALMRKDVIHAEEEMGDLLFAISQVGRHLNIDSELALNKGNEKFIKRFVRLIDEAGGAEKFKALDINRMNELWQAIKLEP